MKKSNKFKDLVDKHEVLDIFEEKIEELIVILEAIEEETGIAPDFIVAGAVTGKSLGIPYKIRVTSAEKAKEMSNRLIERKDDK